MRHARHGVAGRQGMLLTDISSVSGSIPPPSPRRSKSDNVQMYPTSTRHERRKASLPTIMSFEQQKLRGTRISQSMDPIPLDNATTVREAFNKKMNRSREILYLSHSYVPEEGNCSSLPRTHSHSCGIDSAIRGSKQYSSARYPSGAHPKIHPIHNSDRRHRLCLSRNTPHHGTEDKQSITFPLNRNHMTSSEKTEGEDFSYPKRSAGELQSSHYQNVSSTGLGMTAPSLTNSPRRKHDIIPEDPSAYNFRATVDKLEHNLTDGGMVELPAVVNHQVPRRSRSMSMQSDGRRRHASSLTPMELDTAMSRAKSACLRRGSSLLGHLDATPRASFPMVSSDINKLVNGRQSETDGSESEDTYQRQCKLSYEPISPRFINGETKSMERGISRRGISEYLSVPRMDEFFTSERIRRLSDISYGTETESTMTCTSSSQGIMQQVSVQIELLEYKFS